MRTTKRHVIAPSLECDPRDVSLGTVRLLKRVYRETGSILRASDAAGLTEHDADRVLFAWLGVPLPEHTATAKTPVQRTPGRTLDARETG